MALSSFSAGGELPQGFRAEVKSRPQGGHVRLDTVRWQQPAPLNDSCASVMPSVIASQEACWLQPSM